MNKQLLELIENFVGTKRKSSGGWAPVMDYDLEELSGIIRQLVNEKWESDPDGDRPIDWRITDRTKFEPQHFFFLPYLHDSDIEEIDKYIDLAQANVQMAMDRLDVAFKIKRMRQKELKGKDK